MTAMKILYYSFFVVICSNISFAQSNNTIGFLPKIALSSTLSPKLKLVNALESRQVFVTTNSTPKKQYDYILTDITNILSFRAGNRIKLNLGYLFRIRAQKIFHRSIQQLTMVSTYDGLRIGHRIATDQTFSDKEKTTLRLRYRVTIEKSLNGLRVDRNEFYIKINNEYLGSHRNKKSDLEIRLTPFIGYELNQKNKVELGIDYRIDNFMDNQNGDHAFWMAINWFYNL